MNRRVVIVLAILGGSRNFYRRARHTFAAKRRRLRDRPSICRGRACKRRSATRFFLETRLYLAGRIGLDPKTGKAPDKIEDEIKIFWIAKRGASAGRHDHGRSGVRTEFRAPT